MAGGAVDSAYPVPEARSEKDRLLDPPPVYFVRVCGFTFEFWSIEHIAVALAFFRQKIHSSSRLSGNWGEHDVTQRWFERLPFYLQETGKRERVIAALERALAKFS